MSPPKNKPRDHKSPFSVPRTEKSGLSHRPEIKIHRIGITIKT